MARSLPNNQEAEQALLSTMFLSKYALDKAVDTLQEDDFFYNNNKIIFNTLVDLSKKNVPIDMPSVVTEIKNNDKLNEVRNPFCHPTITVNLVSENSCLNYT